MNGMKMKKCFGKTHPVVKLLLILWMTSLIHIAVGEYEVTYINKGARTLLVNQYSYGRSGFYEASLLQTYATNGFRAVFRHLELSDGVQLQIGTGNDPSDKQSVITTIHGYIDYEPDDVYADTNEMWLAATGPNGHRSFNRVNMAVLIISIDLSTLFTCSSPKKIMPSTVICDGIYHCDHYEDEQACDNSATYLQRSKSHFIYIPSSNLSRLYYTTFLQTKATYGFRVVFRYLMLNYGVEVKIGTGNNPSDIQSGITTIHGFIRNAPDDVFVDTNEMWFVVIGAKEYSALKMDVEIISIDLSTFLTCSSPQQIMPPTFLCDGIYHCDQYEDELACSLHRPKKEKNKIRSNIRGKHEGILSRPIPPRMAPDWQSRRHHTRRAWYTGTATSQWDPLTISRSGEQQAWLEWVPESAVITAPFELTRTSKLTGEIQAELKELRDKYIV